ncbi:class I SAM-dependent methyltransferase [Roseateles albus]|uniref:Class I SAM-dependent methyltransferase n=1 Tax=Roseateles albus TaxID=2987525 RepID=A0ABT5KGK1_9BURK|nr:class I SAM-dependent methyltransferase [Roseateles albus]MDC8773047.1 class I SAM-dependent methyltransferase [Roseateles albus]
MMARRVAPETLDQLAPADPAAIRSRRDLLRVHRAMGTRAILARGWQDLVSGGVARLPLRILELGAGDGRLLLGVARELAPHWPCVHLTLLDQQDIVSPATLAAYAALGWTVQVQRDDVLAWAARPDEARPDEGLLGAGLQRWDLISTALFLHHFEGDPLDRLLAAVASRSDRFFAYEPRRSSMALLGSHLVGVLGANAVTREDAVLSVQAGFRGEEISAIWPRGTTSAWNTREFAAGMFSHCFSARRAGIE